MTPHPIAHAVVYGDSGAGKSTFAATWPKPMLVFCFDPFTKEGPYLRLGNATRDDYGGNDPLPAMQWRADITPVTTVTSRKTGKLLVTIEHYLDADPTAPTAYSRFLTRLGSLHNEYENYRTVNLDSVTFMELAARKYHQYVLNPRSKEPRQWYAGSTEQLEEVLMGRFGSLPLNVVVIAHVDQDKDEVHGTFVRNPAAPGRMRARLAAGYGELYHAYVARDAQTREAQYLLQTRSDALWNASSQIDAPDPCPAHYAALWSNHEADEVLQ